MSRYIPKDSHEVFFDDIPAVVYVYGDVNNSPSAIGYFNKRNNHDFNIKFRTVGQCKDYILTWVNNLRESKKYREEMKAKNKGLTHNLHVGDILNGSWGYDQTNVEYFQIVGMSKSRKSVHIRELCHATVEGSEGFMSCIVMPIKDKFTERSEVIKNKRVQVSAGSNGKVWVSVKLHESCYLYPWDGKADYKSWYA